MENYYIINRNTNKVELHFDKTMYLGLEEETKKEIKSCCLWSRFGSCWVSRGYVGSWSARKVIETAQRLGLVDQGAEGEKMSFAEQMERKAERAEARAERYEIRADKAQERGEALQKPIEEMRGDIAFFTQPNINSSAGRAFTNRRNRMFEAWERGFDEFKRSEYWTERAETARKTAQGCKLQSIDFCERRIKECNHDIKALGKNIESYKKQLEKIEAGEEIKRYNGDVLTADVVNDWIESTLDRIEAAVDKANYYQAMIDQQGGIKYNKDNINIGDVVKTSRTYRGTIEVIRKGSVNFSGRDSSGWPCEYSYAEIIEVVKHAESEREIKHGFKVGDSWNIKIWNNASCSYEPSTVEIVKITPDKATIKINGGRAKALSIRCGFDGGYYIPIEGASLGSGWLKPYTESAAV